MKRATAVICGLISGLMIYVIFALLFSDGTPSVLFFLITYLAGSAFSIWLFLKWAPTVSSVLLRVFLVGAAEWLALIPANLLTEMGHGVRWHNLLTASVLNALAFLFLICAAITYFVGRDAREQVKAQQAAGQEAA